MIAPIIKLQDQKDNRIQLNHEGKNEVEIYFKGIKTDDDLTIDLYPIENQAHPERHFGYWVFSTVEDGAYCLHIDFSSFTPGSIFFTRGKKKIEPDSNWINSGIKPEPVIDFQIVLRRKKKISRLLHFNLLLGQASELERFYQEGEGGIYHIDDFNRIFHEERIRLLKRIFCRHLNPGDRVLDAGSGRGIFHLLENPTRSTIICLDLSFHDFQPKQGLHQIHYLQGSLFSMPFPENTFQMVFSGEVIEHIPDPEAALANFYRILKPGGFLVLTTPNSDRLINRVRGFRAPLSREHVSEYGKRDWEDILYNTGFRKIHTSGIYIELFLSYWRRHLAADWIRSRKKLRALSPLARVLMRAGNILPSMALDLVFIYRK